MALFDANWQQIHYSYFVSDSGVLTLGQTGTYILAIEPRSSEAGAGTVRFKVASQGHVDLPAPPVSESISMGASVSGNLSAASDTKTYGFDLAQAKRLYFDVLSNTP